MADREDLEILSVSTTVATPTEAKALAARLVESRLVACAQIGPGLRSHYHWEGEVRDEAEVLIILKTLPAALPALEAFLAEHHPYDLPQMLSIRMRASASYAQWVRDEVRLPPAAPT